MKKTDKTILIQIICTIGVFACWYYGRWWFVIGVFLGGLGVLIAMKKRTFAWSMLERVMEGLNIK